uniref:RNase H type-1 domain-containing protein n=1 Tax=Aegilops tauschii subsp. strangulata TaxID=200361 RepID=A0A453Q8I1_AEGTS
MVVREVWNLPDDVIFNFSGPNWLLILLDQLTSPVREQIIFMFWRAWHPRNDLIFGKGKETISASVSFVQNYWGSFSSCHTNMKMEVINKGTERLDGFIDTNGVKERVVNWQPPDPEFIKINVDASFVEAISAASVGVVARNHMGEVIISSWDYIGVCNSVVEAELRATLAGPYIGITLHKPIILEIDCSFMASFLGNDYLDRSPLVDLKMKALSISRLMTSFKIPKINRRANRVMHEIAKFSFVNRSDGVLLNSVPTYVAEVVIDDCMNVF